MITVAVGLLKRFGGWLLAILSVAAAVCVAMRASRIVGKAQAETEAAHTEAKQAQEQAKSEITAAKDSAATEIGTVKGAIDVSSDVNRLDAGVAADRLRDEWSRD